MTSLCDQISWESYTTLAWRHNEIKYPEIWRHCLAGDISAGWRLQAWHVRQRWVRSGDVIQCRLHLHHQGRGRQGTVDCFPQEPQVNNAVILRRWWTVRIHRALTEQTSRSLFYCRNKTPAIVHVVHVHVYLRQFLQLYKLSPVEISKKETPICFFVKFIC